MACSWVNVGWRWADIALSLCPFRVAQKQDTFEFYVTEHLRMSGIYWALMSMDLIQRLDDMVGSPGQSQAICDWVLSCQTPDGGFAGNVGHDSHILYTLSAVQILAILDRLDLVDADRIAGFVRGLQQPDGSFAGDQYGEVDTRFSYCALNCCDILGRMDSIDVKKAAEFGKLGLPAALDWPSGMLILSTSVANEIANVSCR